jgi:acylphosphatase
LSERARAHVRACGRVQGVFFRAEARERARSLGIDGWVTNARDGSVEAVLEGDRERVESLVRWFGRGPSLAAVEDVEVAWEEPRGEQGFAVR